MGASDGPRRMLRGISYGTNSTRFSWAPSCACRSGEPSSDFGITGLELLQESVAEPRNLLSWFNVVRSVGSSLQRQRRPHVKTPDRWACAVCGAGWCWCSAAEGGWPFGLGSRKENAVTTGWRCFPIPPLDCLFSGHGHTDHLKTLSSGRTFYPIEDEGTFGILCRTGQSFQ